MTRLLVLASGAGVVGAHSITMGGAEAARGPFAFDGGAKLGNLFGVSCRGSGARSCGLGDDELFDGRYLFGGELGEDLVARDEVVEHRFFVGGGRG